MPNRRSPDADKLRTLLNVPPKERRIAPDQPLIPQHAPPFRPEPFVTGEDTAQLVKELLQIAPELAGQFTGVNRGPTSGFLKMLLRDQVDPQQFNLTNILGAFSHKDRDIFLTPGPFMTEEEPIGVLAHEMAHAIGKRHGEGPEEAAELASKVFRRKPEQVVRFR